MPVKLPLHKMSLSEKLAALEAIWEDLSQDDAYKSPSWHAKVLADTERAFANGKATFSDWEQAKRKIRRKADQSR